MSELKKALPPQFNLMTLKAVRRVHFRQDDIERSRPPFMTPRGMVGNGDEHSKVWRR